jgi:hypothetical protein
MTFVGLGGGGINGPLALYMEAHVRLVRTTDNLEIFSEDYDYLGNAQVGGLYGATQKRENAT